MSSNYVRQMLEQWAKDPAVVSPFYNTVNEQQNPNVDIWFTAMYEAETRDKLTFCQAHEERGLIELIFSGRAGRGYTALLAQAEADAATIAALTDATGQFVIRNTLPPDEFSGGSAGKWYSVTIPLEYSFFT